jgi:16S rRNA (cytosine967-C5)-methyltransferase
LGEAPSGKKNPRAEAFRILCRVEQEQSYADSLLDCALKGNWDERDKRLLVELVNGAIRWRGFLDYVLEQAVSGGLERLDLRTKNLLRLGAYQLLKTRKLPAYAVVNESVELARIQGLHSSTLTNAVLRAIIKRFKQLRWPSEEREPAHFLAIKESHPEWLVRRWIGHFGYERTKALCQIDNLPARVVLRTNRLRANSEQLQNRLKEEGLKAEKGAWCEETLVLEQGSPGHSRCFGEGLFQIQDEASTLVGRLADPKPGELVVDICAAPGGKATHLAEMMADQGTVPAFDLHLRRLALVRENAGRLGLKSIVPVVADGRHIALKHKADRVLVDAPCSGTGVLRRRVDLRWKLREEQIRELASLQAGLLESASGMVKPGGVLVYSTCTLEPEENEGVAKKFLGKHGEFVLERAESFVPRGLVEPEGWLKTYPEKHGVDGGFAVRLKKRKH